MKEVDLSFAFEHLSLKSYLPSDSPEEWNEREWDQQRVKKEISIIISSAIDKKLNIPSEAKQITLKKNQQISQRNKILGRRPGAPALPTIIHLISWAPTVCQGPLEVLYLHYLI